MKLITKTFAVVAVGAILTSGCQATTEASTGPTKTGKVVAIYKDALKKQCFADGISLETMTSTLNVAGVEVACAERHNDGMIYSQACGSNEGTINVFAIDSSDLETAKTLGFSELSTATSAIIKPGCFTTKRVKK